MKAVRAIALAFALLCCPSASNAAPMASRFALQGDMRQGGVVLGTAPQGVIALALDGRPVPIGPDRRFILGFDRDQAVAAALVAQLRGGTAVTETLAVAPRAWQVEHVDVAQRPSRATPEYLAMRTRELDRIKAARARDSASGGWRQRFIWPARGRISGRFGSQRVYRGEPGAYHSGVDVAAGAGAPVAAPAEGVVVLAGPPAFSLEGNLVIVDHGMGLNSAFLHLSSIDVRQGDVVRQGQRIGAVGATGRATGPHLHWSMKWADARIDPAALAAPMER